MLIHMNERGKKEILTDFRAYIEEYKMFEAEWYRLRSWQYIKQFRNLRVRHRLTTEYQRKMKSWGL